ncbi:MAG: peptidoglycan-binding protein [Treponema sp.]|nr:peptidoglycan-binding protein [Treponema sp.]
MSCEKILGKIYEQEDMSLLGRLEIGLHLLICPDCARKAERLELCQKTMREDFFPPPPQGLEDNIMAAITEEECEETLEAKGSAVPGGVSLGGWVVAGLVLLVSLTTIFFGMEFNNIALAAGMSFMIPIGITVGIVLTVYGALLIGSHLKKLSKRFGLES